MRYKNIYRVTCETFRNRCHDRWHMDIEAYNKAEAIATCKYYWSNPAHPFHMEAYRYRDDEIIDGCWYWSSK